MRDFPSLAIWALRLLHMSQNPAGVEEKTFLFF
jgi:hypothetical protein